MQTNGFTCSIIFLCHWRCFATLTGLARVKIHQHSLKAPRKITASLHNNLAESPVNPFEDFLTAWYQTVWTDGNPCWKIEGSRRASKPYIWKPDGFVEELMVFMHEKVKYSVTYWAEHSTGSSNKNSDVQKFCPWKPGGNRSISSGTRHLTTSHL